MENYECFMEGNFLKVGDRYILLREEGEYNQNTGKSFIVTEVIDFEWYYAKGHPIPFINQEGRTIKSMLLDTTYDEIIPATNLHRILYLGENRG